MTVTFENGTIKVLLTKAETINYCIDGLLLGQDIKTSKTKLIGIYKAATQKLPVNLAADRLIIEIHPNFSGGCEIFFTPESTRVIPKHRSPLCVIIENSTVEGMITTIGQLLSVKDRCIKSSLYFKNKVYRLLIYINHGSKPLLTTLKCLGDRSFLSNVKVAVTTEHWQPICQDKAIETLGNAFFKAP